MDQNITNLCIENIIHCLSELYTDTGWHTHDSQITQTIANDDLINNKTIQCILECANALTGYNQKKESKSVISQPLNSIFNLIYKNGTNLKYSDNMNEAIPYPLEDPQIDVKKRNKIFEKLLNSLNDIWTKENSLDRILDLCKDYLSCIPSGTDKISSYISLADSIQFSTCLCICFYKYISETSGLNCEQGLNNKLYQDETLLLFSCDISGIQKFIYTVSGKSVLKSLRSRSFYLDMLLEHVLISILHEMELPISNIIYSGGGRAYLLLPNTQKTRNTVHSAMQNINNWLLNHFDISLYIAHACTSCSAEDLLGEQNESSYSNVFIRLSSELSKNKVNRYSTEQIRFLNKNDTRNHESECRICSRSDSELDEGTCSFCRDFMAVSSSFLDDSLCITILSKKLNNGLPCLKLPSVDQSTNYLYFLKPEQITELDRDHIVQIYHSGETGLGLKFETGAYAYSADGNSVTFEQFAEDAEGIDRIAVLRADIDNLGVAFMKGFEYAKVRGFNPLLLTATLSTQLSLFFKHSIKSIVCGDLGGVDSFSLTESRPSQKKLVIVYSGGDDMFLAGSWNDVIDAAVDIRNCFKKYTANTLTFSAGIGLFEMKYPLYAMAEETEHLVDFAKSVDENKNGIALFGSEISKDKHGNYHSDATHCYHWNVFAEKVVDEKLRLIQNYFTHTQQMESANGNAFLYRMKTYIEETYRNPQEKINIARFAYLLARMEPSETDNETQRLYSDFSTKMYRWIFSSEDRRQLLTAMMLFIYLERRVNENGRKEIEQPE